MGDFAGQAAAIPLFAQTNGRGRAAQGRERVLHSKNRPSNSAAVTVGRREALVSMCGFFGFFCGQLLVDGVQAQLKSVTDLISSRSLMFQAGLAEQ